MIKRRTKITKFGLILLFVFQILDGVLTYKGVTGFNTLEVEGNPLLRTVMEYFGVIPGLVGIKLLACLIIIFMYNNIEELITTWFSIVIYLVVLAYSMAILIWYLVLF